MQRKIACGLVVIVAFCANRGSFIHVAVPWRNTTIHPLSFDCPENSLRPVRKSTSAELSAQLR